jgi:hypothetical protein
VAAWRWFESGELVSTEQLKRISAEAMTLGRARAAELIDRARSARDVAVGRSREGEGIFSRMKKKLPFRRKPRQISPPKQ